MLQWVQIANNSVSKRDKKISVVFFVFSFCFICPLFNPVFEIFSNSFAGERQHTRSDHGKIVIAFPRRICKLIILWKDIRCSTHSVPIIGVIDLFTDNVKTQSVELAMEHDNR